MCVSHQFCRFLAVLYRVAARKDDATGTTTLASVPAPRAALRDAAVVGLLLGNPIARSSADQCRVLPLQSVSEASTDNGDSALVLLSQAPLGPRAVPCSSRIPLDDAFRIRDPVLLKGYLNRLKLAEVSLPPTLDTLRCLVRAHVTHIPYENIDIHLHRPPPPLHPLACVERLVCRGRGGYCFVLVPAFAALLTTLDFAVSLHKAAVGVRHGMSRHSFGNHVALLVHFSSNDVWVADVGLGDGPSQPFPLRTHTWQELRDHGGGGYTFGVEHLSRPYVFANDDDSMPPETVAPGRCCFVDPTATRDAGSEGCSALADASKTITEAHPATARASTEWYFHHDPNGCVAVVIATQTPGTRLQELVCRGQLE
eukprot:m.612411 g.612411  ORF g.612411 m.612411 type:complete len:369 (+) comp22500_c0_seq85:287-1393(+)